MALHIMGPRFVGTRVTFPFMVPVDLEISTDPARIDIDLVHGFLAASYWADGRPREVVERSIAHSLCFGAYCGGRLVEFGRVGHERGAFGYCAVLFVWP